MEHSNSMAPFPIFDTEYVEDVRDKIKNMEENQINYDDEPVVACKYCKNLHIVNDKWDNAHCMRCGSVNELKEYKNIFEYQENINNDN